MNDPIWSPERLWQKSKLFLARAYSAERYSEEFYLWLALAVELLGRSALANIHPVLLADPRDGKNILRAFGVAQRGSGISIPFTTVVDRLEQLVSDFKSEHVSFCKEIAAARNAELHSGTDALPGSVQRSWMPRFYRTAHVLTSAAGYSLQQFLGPEEAEVAAQVMAEADSALRKETLRIVGTARGCWERGEQQIHSYLPLSGDKEWQLRVCPACNNSARLTGQLVSALPPRADGDQMIEESVYVPLRLECEHCGLLLSERIRLEVVELGDPFSVSLEYDIDDYFYEEHRERFIREYEPSDYGDYGND